MRPRQVTVGGRQRRERAAGPPPFYRLVYRVVRRVPRGRVVTYGQVAAILGQPRGARAVGMALGALRGRRRGTWPSYRRTRGRAVGTRRPGTARATRRDGVRVGRRRRPEPAARGAPPSLGSRHRAGGR